MTRKNARLACAIAAILSAAASAAPAAELPVPCATGSCGPTGPTWLSSGIARFVQTPNQLTVTQESANATLNWASFNIGADGRVVFQQPDSTSVALNRIFQADPSRIFGQLQANGRVWLLNRNGIVFGQGSQVNVGGLLASSLDLTPDALELGIARAASRGSPAFDVYRSEGAELASGAVRVEAGSRIETPAGGQVFLFAPEVSNQGRISTPDGQIVLGAGKRVFLLASADPDIRGLLVEVGDGGTATNGVVPGAGEPPEVVGELIADRGNVTIAALAVNQNGRVSATTSTRQNGSIRLTARDTTQSRLANINDLTPDRTGTLALGAGSSTTVLLDPTDDSTSVDVNAQPRSQIELYGRTVEIGRGALVRATGGAIDVVARTDVTLALRDFSATPDDSRIVVRDGAVLDVAGAVTSLPMERNSLRVELRGSQLADFPLQRNGALRGEAVYVDVRQSGTRADGSTWQGSPIGDLAGNVTTIARDVRERNLAGGTISMVAQGAVAIADGATLDVSGGRIDWQDGYVRTSRLLGADGRTYDIASASPDREYVGIVGEQAINDQRWGIQARYSLGDPRGNFERGYVEGKDAGSITLTAPRVAVDGRLKGAATIGPNQRLPRTSGFEGLYRPWDQVPAAARLQIGFDQPIVGTIPTNYLTSGIVLGAGRTLDSYRNADGTAFDPLRDAIPEDFDRTWLGESVWSGDFGDLALYANGSIVIPETTTVRPGPGGSLVAVAGRVDVQGDVESAGGTVSIAARRTPTFGAATPATTPGVSVGARSRLDVAGLWTNDSPPTGPGTAPRSPIVLHGGRVSIVAEDGPLTLVSGSVLDVSGGARRGLDGRVAGGAAGSITLSADVRGTGVAPELTLGADLRGYALERGGSLGISVATACVAAAPCEDADAMRFDPAFFTRGGFGSYSLSATLGDLRVQPGTVVTPTQSNYVLREAARSAQSGTPMSAITDVARLPDQVRRPTSLSLAAGVATLQVPGFGDLRIDAGSVIRVEPDASVTLTGNSQIVFAGSIVAPSGDVSLRLTSTSPLRAFRPDQGIWLASGASIDVSGVARVDTTNIVGRRTGEVLSGGNVTLDASRGYVLALPGSRIDLSGSAADLDVRQAGGIYAREHVASEAGSLTINTTEGLVLASSIAAKGGASGAPDGRLEVAISSRRNADEAGTFPLTSRRIVITGDASPLALEPGAPVPDSLNGQAIIQTPVLNAAGFDDVSLTALSTLVPRGLEDFLPPIVSSGEIVFQPDTVLSTDGRVVLEAARISAGGAGRAAVVAPYVSLGPSDALGQEATPVAAGAGRLDVRARVVDLRGELALSGFDTLRLTASDAVRLLGVFPSAGTAYLGRLHTTGDVEIQSPTTYVGTLSSYRIESDRAVRWLTAAAGPAAPVLSAGGSLTVKAADIRVDGRIEAPLGSLAFESPQFRLGATGQLVTSLSTTVPFGRVQAGRDWVYALEEGLQRVYPNGLPEKSISITADSIEVAAGAAIDVSGFGDVLAQEFQPGPTGTIDVLSPTSGSGLYAILPGRNEAYAAFDPTEYRGSSLRPGDSVYLAGADGVPAGTYALYPASYALLPGARLVSVADGFADIAPGDRYTPAGGGTVVAGYRTVAGTGSRPGTYAAFLVRDAAEIQKLGRYDVATGNAFFKGSATSAGGAAPSAPRDAGSLVLNAGSALRFDGAFRAAVGAAGRAAEVDIAATRLRVVSTLQAQTPSVVQITGSQLANLSAGSILLGGRRTRSGDATRVDPTASEVVIGRGVNLDAAELILAARDLVRVESGASLRSSASSGATERALELAGGAALVRTSAGAQPTFTRVDGASGAGSVELQAGANLVSAGSILAAGTGPSEFGGSITATGGALTLDVAMLTLRAAGPAGTDQITVAQLAAAGARDLSIRAGGALNVAGAVTLSGESLALSAAELSGATGADELRITGKRFELGGTATAPASASGEGRFTVAADAATFAGGNLALGFSSVALDAGEPFAIGGSGTLTAAGDVAFSGGIVAAGPGAEFVLATPGAVSVSGGAASDALRSALGASVAFRARAVTIDGVVAARAGRIAVESTEAVSVGSGAVLDVSAPRVVIDDVLLPIPGGSVALVSTGGDVAVAAGARIDAAALGRARGGTVSLQSLSGRVSLDGAVALGGSDGGGRLAVDGGGADLTRLASLATQGGAASFAVRRRDAGSLVLDAGTLLRAAEVELVADQGAIFLRGDVDARSATGGSVALHARDAVAVGGRVQLESTVAGNEFATSRLDVGTGSEFALEAGGRLEFGSGADRQLWIRLPRSQASTLADASTANDAVRLDGAVTGAPDFVVEGYQRYELASGVIGNAQVAATASNPWFADAATFMTEMAGASVPGLQPRIVPGIEIDAPDRLTLAADWNVAAWRFADEAPVITLRAGGDVALDRSLSDGFAAPTGTTAFTLPATPGPSASYRIVAGADFASAAPLATLGRTTSRANVVLAAGTPRTTAAAGTYRMVRTGSGFIDIAASGDLVLTNQASTIYTAGVRSGGVVIPGTTVTGGLGARPYPDNGGDIRVRVGGDVVGPKSNQLVTEWLWRTGGRASEARPRATAWTVAYDYFEQGIGALGGGDVSISAGGSIRDLGVSIPSIGRQVGGTTVSANRVEQDGGGLLRVSAGGDILGGTFYVGRGDAELAAGGRIGAPDPASQNSLAPILALGDSRIAAVARGDAVVETVIDPMLITPSSLIGAVARSYFSTYTSNSATRLTSVGGALRIGTATGPDGPLGAFYSRTIGIVDNVGGRVAPPTVEAYAASGTARLGGPITLWPDARGNLTVIADGDVVLDPVVPGELYSIILSDADPVAYLPTVNSPVAGLGAFQTLANPYLGDAAFYSASPIHGATATTGADPEPMRLVSARGDVSFLPGTAANLGIVFSAKRFRVVAGGDVVSLGIRGQNVAPGDVSSIVAGGSIRYSLQRDTRGQISSSVREISLGGPGFLELVAGGDVNLETSRGVTSEGGARNTALAGLGGASVSVSAGLAGRQPDTAAFEQKYLVQSTAYAKPLAEYVERVTGEAPSSGADALARYRALTPAQRKAFLEQVLFAELRAGGRAAAQPGPDNNDFTRAFTALETYFPGSNPDVEAGETTPYAGDIRLVFSRIYTLFGGDVRLLAPGGEVNVGLATPPASFGIAKPASELGIVVQSVGDVQSLSYGDFQVNESRVFAGDGGDILVWSTRGDIDAGRGAKTAISAPPPVITIDQQGQPKVEFPAAFVGSGIQTLATTPDVEPGDVDLFAPRGVVNAGDAGIVAGNLTIAATAVLGANNITVSGTAVGVPVDTGGLGAALAGASASAGSASNTTTADLAGSNDASASETPLADSAIAFLEVFVTGLGEEGCRPDDLECLKRQPRN